jgi:predicted pore-forming effector associated with SMODS systems
MKNVRHEAVVWGQLITFLVIWAGLLYLTNTPLQINVEAIKKLPEVVTIYMVLYLVFSRWAWRLAIFRGWLVPFPDLTGTWEGTLITTWRYPETGAASPPIDIRLVIRHQFDHLSCVLYTAESMSWSTAATLYGDDADAIKRLSYTYINQPKAAVRDRSAISNGAVVLQLTEGRERQLEGQYWTDRKTTGDIALRFKTRRCADSFN